MKLSKRSEEMPLKIGLFSLKDGVGCTAMSVHIANYIAGNADLSVALAEKVASKVEPKYQLLKTQFDEDGTCVINQVHYYPAITRIEPTENVVIYDLGQINFMFKFPSDIDKLFLCTDDSDTNLEQIAQFKRNLLTDEVNKNINFEIILFGGNRESLTKYRNTFKTSVTVVADKKEPRLDAQFANKISMLFRTTNCGLNPPEYHSDWTYQRTDFYTEEEYQALQREKAEQAAAASGNAKKQALFRFSLFGKKNDHNTEEESASEKSNTNNIQNSGVSVAEKKVAFDANIFNIPSFVDVPEPEYVPVTDLEQETETNVEDKRKPAPVIDIASLSSVEMKKLLKQKQKEEAAALREENERKAKAEAEEKARREREKKIAAIAEARKRAEEKKAEEIAKKEWIENRKKQLLNKASSTESAPKNITKASSDFPENGSRCSEHVVYSHNLTAPGLLGQAIEGINRGGKFCCNLYIATKTDRLIIFPGMDIFFKKFDKLKDFISSANDIHYIVLTYNNEMRKPSIYTEDEKLSNVFRHLTLVDNELRSNTKMTQADFKKHHELSIFDEILLAS